VSPLRAAFGSDYAEARARFLAAAETAGAALEAFEHPTGRSPDGGPLAIDVARIGARDAPALLVVSSGTHGVEGFCGSGIQVALLDDPSVAAALGAAQVELLMIHAVNPYGFAHLRRVNEDNVDLNRNFRNFTQPIAPNAAYREIHGFIVPTAWPPTPDTEQALAAYLARHGPARLQAAVTIGQHEFDDGLFFGGRAPAWSNTTLRAIFARYGAARRQIGWIDVHTGLGPAGHGEKIYSGPEDAGMLARTRAWFGVDVTSFYAGSSSSSAVTGSISAAATESCPGVSYAGIGLEFGTVSLPEVLQALRADQWLTNQPDRQPAAHAPIKRALRDAFYVDTDEWRGMVYGQGRAAVLQAVKGLAAGT
jgi:hypothetical protein